MQSKLYDFLNIRNLAISVIISIAVMLIVIFEGLSDKVNFFNSDPQHIAAVISIISFLLLILIAIILSKIISLLIRRSKGVIGSRLQAKIILMFCMVALIPAIIMMLFTAIFFNYGIKSWFDNKVSSAIEGSVAIAISYLEDHKKIIKDDIRALADDISRSANLLKSNNELFHQVVTGIAGGSLQEVIVFTRDEIIAAGEAKDNIKFEVPQEEYLLHADKGKIVIISQERAYRIRAVVKLYNFTDTYLLVSRLVDPQILNYVELTRGAAFQYKTLKENISSIQIKFFILFIIVSLLLLLMFIWIGLIFSVSLVKPITNLLNATEKIKEGDFDVVVAVEDNNDELTDLINAFNNMTDQLKIQRNKLAAAQRWAAWSDVARRIAHEIKNPLTPIQLATERLNRKFKTEVQDKIMFEKYLNTISKNVANIGQMVEEFSSFARLPKPVFNIFNICEVLEEISFSFKSDLKNFTIETRFPDKPVYINGDINQISRVFINLLKNSEEAVVEKNLKKSRKNNYILIDVEIIEKNNSICRIKIIDNGIGFDSNILDRVSEPYVTTKTKGTGLGLSIAKKIIEDHAGNIAFLNHDKGACVIVEFGLNL